MNVVSILNIYEQSKRTAKQWVAANPSIRLQQGVGAPNYRFNTYYRTLTHSSNILLSFAIFSVNGYIYNDMNRNTVKNIMFLIINILIC